MLDNACSRGPVATKTPVARMDSPLSPHATMLPSTAVDALVTGWLTEDCPSFDHGAVAAGTGNVSANLYLKSPGVVAGLPFFAAVMERVGCTVCWEPGLREGRWMDAGNARDERVRMATVSGPAHLLLRGERVALNALAECSGVATAARRAANVAADKGWAGSVAGTRKTTPGFRLVQKYAFVVGGMDPHRMDLASMAMLKDNHLAAANGVGPAVAAVKESAGFSVKIDVECGTAGEALAAAKAGADVVMLDNFSVEEFREAARRVKKAFPHVVVEGSGGLDFNTLSDYMTPEADVLSFSVNRHAKALDMSLKVEKE